MPFRADGHRAYPHRYAGDRGCPPNRWVFPLLSPPPRTHNNKILWVSRVTLRPGSDLRIAAQRMHGTHPLGTSVSRTVTGGPGPSIIDLPASGCWRLTLRWSGRVDSLDLDYAANADA